MYAKGYTGWMVYYCTSIYCICLYLLQTSESMPKKGWCKGKILFCQQNGSQEIVQSLNAYIYNIYIYVMSSYTRDFKKVTQRSYICFILIDSSKTSYTGWFPTESPTVRAIYPYTKIKSCCKENVRRFLCSMLFHLWATQNKKSRVWRHIYTDNG